MHTYATFSTLDPLLSHHHFPTTRNKTTFIYSNFRPKCPTIQIQAHTYTQQKRSYGNAYIRRRSFVQGRNFNGRIINNHISDTRDKPRIEWGKSQTKVCMGKSIREQG